MELSHSLTLSSSHSMRFVLLNCSSASAEVPVMAGQKAGPVMYLAVFGS